MDVKNLVARIKNHIYWEKIEKGYFDKMDDESFLKMAYKRKLGKELNLDNPETFNEKLQWLKLHDRRPEYTMMVDKFEVKEYVSNIIGKEHIIPTIGVWDSFDDIDFQQLPDKFVLKCTHDSGGLAICKDKESFDKVAAKKKIEKSLQSNFYRGGREWPYKNVIPRIIAEKYMEDTEGNGLTDYKFYCFNGSPEYLYVSQGMDNHKTARISFLTMNWENAPFGRKDYMQFEKLPPKPQRFDEMKLIAKKLSKDHSFLRVDLYEIKGEIYFSELTFSPCCGFMPFVPDEFDKKLGDMLQLKDEKL